MTLIDGKAISEQVKQEIATEVAEIVARGGKRPHLAAILVGHDGGSETYVAAKVKACEACGFKSSLIRYETDVTEEELLAKVRDGDIIRVNGQTGELTLLVDEAELAAREPHIPDLSASRVGTGRELFSALREKLSGAEQGATCITF